MKILEVNVRNMQIRRNQMEKEKSPGHEAVKLSSQWLDAGGQGNAESVA